MTVQDELVKIASKLPIGVQQTLLAIAQQLPQQSAKPLRDPYGLWSDLGIDFTETEIREAREEAWKNFPRDI